MFAAIIVTFDSFQLTCSYIQCLRGSLLIFKFCQPRNNPLFRLAPNKPLVGSTLMTTGGVKVSIAISRVCASVLYLS